MSKRGTSLNLGNRFTDRTSERFDDGWGSIEEEENPGTEFFNDTTRQAFATNDSPDIPFTHSINPYRGCEHGCAYCYARPTHEYLGFNPALDFETKIMVKRDAARLAREAMMKPSWTPTTVSISGVTDPYQPAERRFRITRQILEVMLEFRNPVGIVTKNALVARDIDLLAELARFQCAAVFVSVTTLDRDLARRMEPRTSTPERRLEAVRRLSDAGIPVGVMTAPIIPGLTEDEIPALLEAAAEAGARHAAFTIVRLPLAVKPIFLDWLEREEPARAAKVRNALIEMRGERMNRSEFGARMRGKGPRANVIRDLFNLTARRLGLNSERLPISTANFRRPAADDRQIDLFGSL
ncbi:MAG TPA: PA0069 family radical SAM protein [Candidatus Kapabacteria bacterium]|nr:PA0069 family radical SAM protein [Candidatus Kapabacteria bacterium]